MTIRILAVCLGNICRSPTAEGVIRAMAAAAGLDIAVDSAGTGGWHVGDPPHGPAVRAAAARGYDLSGLTARQMTEADFEAFDLILAMDHQNASAVERLRPPGSATPVRLFMSYALEAGPDDIPDPYYTGRFDEAIDLVERAARGLVAQLQTEDANAPKAL
jgi:protein-tyrosine phosphatase